jgi:hypothetical protein
MCAMPSCAISTGKDARIFDPGPVQADLATTRDAHEPYQCACAGAHAFGTFAEGIIRARYWKKLVSKKIPPRGFHRNQVFPKEPADFYSVIDVSTGGP